MIGAAAAPAVMSALSAAAPYIAASVALTAIGEQQRQKARSNAMNQYNTEVENIGQRSRANAHKATNKFNAAQMAEAQAADTERQQAAYESSRLPDVDAAAITGAGAPESIGDFASKRVAGEKEQAGREFDAKLKLGSLANTLFGGQLAQAEASALNRNNASLIEARKQRLDYLDLPQADAKGQLWRMGGQILGGVGNIAGAAGAAGASGAAKAVPSAVSRTGMGGIGTNNPVTVSKLLVGGAPKTYGLGGVRLKG